MITTITIADTDFEIDYDAKILVPAIPATRFSPSAPMEYEVSIIGIKRRGDAAGAYLSLPSWLAESIELQLENDSSIADAVQDYYS